MIQGKLFGLWHFRAIETAEIVAEALPNTPVLPVWLRNGQILFWNFSFSGRYNSERGCTYQTRAECTYHLKDFLIEIPCTEFTLPPWQGGELEAWALLPPGWGQNWGWHDWSTFFSSSCISFLAGCLSQVLPQGRPQSDEGELRGRCVPCKCHQVCIGHFNSFSV